MAKATKSKPRARRNSRNGKSATAAMKAIVERDPPREPACRNVPHSKATLLPRSPLDAFLVHPPGSFEIGEVWAPQVSDEQWEAARLLLAKHYVLGICCDPEEAVNIASVASLRIPTHTLFAYDEQEQVLWLETA